MLGQILVLGIDATAAHHGRMRNAPLVPSVPAVLCAVALSSLAGCGDQESSGDRGATPSSTTSGVPAVASGGGSAASGEGGSEASGRAPAAARAVRITVDGSAFAGRLDDTPTARALAAQLPLTVDMGDHGGAEKTGALPRRLTTAGAPDAHDPRAGDLGYYAPGGDLVLYYDDAAPVFDGIVRIGRFSGDLDALRRAEDVRVRVERQQAGR